MRPLAMATLLAFVASPAVAADKDEDKAKEVTVAFLKAVKAKDLVAVLKTVDVPFLFEDAREPVAKLDDLKAGWEKLLLKVKPEKIGLEVALVWDVTSFREQAVIAKDKAFAELVEKMAGKTGFVVTCKHPNENYSYVFVRIKDGKAKVAGFGD